MSTLIKKSWRKKVSQLLVAAMAVGSFTGPAIPQNVSAAGGAGGVGSSVYSVTYDVYPGGIQGAALWLKADQGAQTNPAGQLTGWADQTGNNQFTVQGTPDYKAAGVNFNPAVSFQNTTAANQDPNEYLLGNHPITFKEGYAVFTSTTGTVIGSALPVAPRDYGVGIFTEWNGSLYAGNGDTGTYFGFPFNGASRFNMAAFDLGNGTDSKGWLNGKERAISGNLFNSVTFTPVVGGTFGGNNTNNWKHLKGDVAEVILFPSSNSIADKQKIESYLALKYGLTLNGGQSDYVASGLTGTKMWTALDNAGYGKRITGIGKDSGSGLEQKQSKSQEADALVTIALGPDIAASNADITAANVPIDQSFFMFSDNGLDAANNDTDAMSNMKRSARVYKVDKTNWADQAITLQLSETNAEATHLLIGIDPTFPGTSDTKAFALQPGGKVTINSSELGDNSYFAFAKEVAVKASAPGGVDGATLWLKADKDAAADLNGQLTGWSDQTGTNQFAVQGTPDYKAAPANFNPAVAFQNTTSYNQNPNEYMIGDKPITFKEGYAVFKQTDGTVVGSAAPRAGGYGVGIFSKWAGKLWAGNGANGTYHGFAFNDASRFHMAAFDMANSTDSQGKLNGNDQAMTRNKSISSIEFTPVIGGAFGGGSSNNWYHYKGDIAEVVLYPASNAPVDKLKVESYLALKYGLTLNHGGSDYAASNYDGTAGTKMWTAADNTGYGKRITGIGRDDGSELQQKQSKSQEAGALVTIALGDGITASNAQNGNMIATDLSFFTFSDNGTIAAKYDGEVPEITTAPQHKLKQLNREFKVDKTNWLDTDITLKLDVTAENPAALYYLVIRDTAGALTEILPLSAEGTVKINSAKLADGNTFTFAKVTKDALQKSVNGVGKLTAGNYTPESWTALQNALTAAKDVLDNPNATQKEIDDALAALEAAKTGLSSSRDKLEAKVNQIKSAMDAGTLKEGDYTADSWQALKDELTRANAVLAQTPAATEQELAQAITKLDEAKAALVDLSALRAKVNEIEGEGLTPSGYTATSWQALQDALVHAKNVLADPSATQAEVDRAMAALEAARAALVAVNKSALQAKVDEINGETNLESLLTPESWEALKEAMAKAQVVLNDPDATQAEVDAALAALQAARQNAVIAGAELTVLDIVYADGSGNPVAVELSPAFDGKQYLNYTGVVPNAVSSVGLDPQTLDPNGQVQITVNGQVVPASDWDNLPLQEGRNVIEVEVTDSNGNKNKYTIEMMRVSSKLESLAAPGYGLNPAFQSDKEAYTMNVPYEVSQLPWTPVALDPEAKIEFSVNGGAAVTVASGTSSPALPLQVGSNMVTVKVTDRNGGVKEYVVTVYRDSDSGSDNGSGTVGGGTGIGGGTPPATGDIITSVNDSTREFATGKKTTEGGHTLTNVEIDAGKLNGILAQGNGLKLAIRVPNEGDVAVKGVTAEQVKRMTDAGSSLEIGNLLAIYPIPGGQLDFDAISKNLNGAKLGDIAVHVDIKRSPQSLIDSARSKATTEGYELLVDPVDLKLTFTNEGRTVSADQLNGYAARYIALPEGIDPNRITTGVVINPDGTMFHLPTVVTKINNRYFALINDLRSSGTYSVIWNPKDFDDVKSHWARADINNIAARLDLAGIGNNTFSPDRNIIRSEFATIVATGMGLMRQNVVENQFEDVNKSDWYHGGVSIASEFEIVLGYDDGLFHGGRNITREQGIAMIARAFNLVEPQRFMSPAEIDATLLKFGDADNVSGWAREVVAKMVAAGIVEGEDGQLLNPQDYMSRAEAAALMRRLLQMTNLID
ncbi:S-layer homology domain-containing protein [Paenibacillus sp. GCM10012303]|uniref:S-layer homology domain-containing protein n=1 Tax=Paenibacillus sp. GCM10012303 TaxID=3317340 RepID=UPI003611D4FE